MKLTKQLEGEVRQLIDAYWDNYIKGDVKAIIPLLDDEYTQVGSAEDEVFFNKKDAVQFIHDTIEQVVGKVEIRNRITRIQPFETIILMSDLYDLYVLNANERIFYAQCRTSHLVKKKKRDGKIIHHHASFPDPRTEEGGNLAIENLVAENLHLRDAVKRRTVELEHKNQELEAAKAKIEPTLADLKSTQAHLVQQEKMASLGQLTAGIAHEVKNLLNFVNNFAQLSVELADELHEELDASTDKTVAEIRDDLGEILADLKQNAAKINEHGRRADGIVKSMLEHARSSPGEHRATDLNAMLDEYVNLAFHGLRAQQQGFHCDIKRNYDETVGKLELAPQEIGRVFPNLLNNAFEAVHEQAVKDNGDYMPTVRVSTRPLDGAVEIQVCDNGIGIPEDIHDKVFEPFFTTKSTGSGTGLGLSLTYDIVTNHPNVCTRGRRMAVTISRRLSRSVLFVILTMALGCSGGRRGLPSGPLSFTEHIAPIVFENCVSCHRPGGSAPFSLLSYRDVESRAKRIVEVTEARYMPPWLPERGDAQFVGERGLDDGEIVTIRRWVDAGAVEGDPAHLPPLPENVSGWALGPPDLVVKAPAYTVPAGAPERYRNLIVPLTLSEARYVATVDLRPCHPSVVHHARIMVDTTASSRQFDAEDAEPGYDGMHLISKADNPGGHFLGWTPGKVATRGADSLAWRLDPGADMVLQLHLRPKEETVTVEPEIAFYFAERPPTRTPTLIMLGAKIIDIPAGATDYTVTDAFTLPVPIQMLSVYPHAHYLGKEMEIYATLPNGRKQGLLHIKDWDFNWQDDYRYAQPITLPAGATLTMHYTFDNSSDNPQNPNTPPRRVVYGSKSSDEMAELLLQVLPQNAGDLARLRRDVSWKDETRDIAYLAHAAFTQGKASAVAGRPDEAIRHFQQALQYRSDDVDILTAMTEAFLAKGDFDAAILVGERAAGLSQRRNAATLGVLAESYASAGQTDRAITTVREAISVASRAGDRARAGELRARLATYREAKRQ